MKDWRRRENIIKANFNHNEWENVVCIQVARDKFQRLPSLNTVIKCPVPLVCWKCLQ
jgi:hypothetical protein